MTFVEYCKPKCGKLVSCTRINNIFYFKKKMNIFPQIVVGTYEEFVLGYNLQFENEKKVKIKLHQSFATHSHQASVRCVAAHNNLMASSGADEYINIYDMVAMEVSTVINYHDSTVTCLEFTPDGSHLVTSNQNGDIAIFRCNDWMLVKLWKEAHKHANGVISISIHPSGSLLLTTGGDNIVRFWNLVKGRQAYATNFSKKCSVGRAVNFGMWSNNGNYYAVCIGNILEIYKTKTACLVYEITASARITYSKFIKKNSVSIATEDGFLEIHSINEKKILLKKKAHENRIKSLASFSINVCKKNKNITKNYIASVDSKGRIKLWQLKINKVQMKFLLLLRGETNCDCRITCLTAVTSNNIKNENLVPEEVNTNNETSDIFIENQHVEINIDHGSKEANSVKKINRNKKRAEKSFNLLELKKRKKIKNGL